MAVPLLKQGEYLIVSLQPGITDKDWLKLGEDLVEGVGKFRSKGAIIDISALDLIDSFAARTLRSIAHACKLRGTETVVVGMQPEVAFAMVQLGLTLGSVLTALDLEEGLVFLRKQAKEKETRGSRNQNNNRIR
jgi:rsbT antagonist protein RsbS